MIARSHYDRFTLEQFLNEVPPENGAPPESDSDIAVHLEHCQECQSTLESLLGEGLTMEAAGELLRDRAAEELTWEPASSDRLTELDRSAFLEASEHPGSLGRFARFEIMEFLGRGGMGIVMRGFDTSLNRHSAVKVLAPELATSAAARKRFSREAKSAAAVVHPHVVPIQTVDEHNGLPYLVMPVVEGQSVDARVRESGPLPVIEAVRIASQVAEGLAAAHGQGLVHRDIKPANVLLENGVERVQITDFGLARAIDDASMTRSGVIAGTPQYMSPEQAHGDAIDHRSDLFSLGSLIYFMLTGHSPFRAETTMGVLNRIGNEQPRSLRSINADIPEWFEQIVMKLLAKPREDRFQTASEVAELLQRWHAHLQQPSMVDPPQELDRKSSLVARSAGSRGGLAKWLIAMAVMGFFVYAGTILVLEAGKGTIRIDTNSESAVPIVIRRGNEVVDELTVSQEGTSIRLKAGSYVIEVDGDDTSFIVEGDQVKLKRGSIWTATIELRDGDQNAASKLGSLPKPPDNSAWDNFLNRCPVDGVAVIRAANPRLRELNQDALEILAAELGVSVVPMNLDVVHPVYHLVKDRILVDHLTGPTTEKALREFIETAAEHLTPQQAGVQPRSVVRFACNYDQRNEVLEYDSWAGVVLAQHNGRVLLLGPTGIADYIKNGHTCLAAIQAENGASVNVPIDVIYAGDSLVNGMAIYEAVFAPKVPSVRLAASNTSLMVRSHVLCAFVRQPNRDPQESLAGYSPRIRWQTHRVITWGESRYGLGPNGIELFEVSSEGDGTPWVMFSPDGRLIGLSIFGPNNGTESVLVPSAIKATLRAAIPYLGDPELKGQLLNQIADEERLPDKHADDSEAERLVAAMQGNWDGHFTADTWGEDDFRIQIHGDMMHWIDAAGATQRFLFAIHDGRPTARIAIREFTPNIGKDVRHGIIRGRADRLEICMNHEHPAGPPPSVFENGKSQAVFELTRSEKQSEPVSTADSGGFNGTQQLPNTLLKPERFDVENNEDSKSPRPFTGAGSYRHVASIGFIKEVDDDWTATIDFRNYRPDPPVQVGERFIVGRPVKGKPGNSTYFAWVEVTRVSDRSADARVIESQLKRVGGQRQFTELRPGDTVTCYWGEKPTPNNYLKAETELDTLSNTKPPHEDPPPFVGFREYWQDLTGMRVGGNDARYIQDNTKLRGGLWIGEVDAGSPAAIAGLESLDALVGLGQWEILSESDLRFVDGQLRMGKLEPTNLKVHFFRRGKGLLSCRIRLDTKKVTNIGTVVLASKFQPGDLDGLRFGKRESARPLPKLEPKSVTSEETKDDSSTLPSLGNGIEEVGLIVGVVPPLTSTEPPFPELFLVQEGGMRKIEMNPTRFTQSVSQFAQPQLSEQSFRGGFEYYAVTFATEKKMSVELEMMAGSAHVYVMDIVGLANEQVRRSLNENDNCEPWLPAGIPMDQQSKLAAQLMNLDGWEKKSGLSHSHVVDHEFNLKPGETRTVSIKPADEKRADEERASDTKNHDGHVSDIAGHGKSGHSVVPARGRLRSIAGFRTLYGVELAVKNGIGMRVVSIDEDSNLRIHHLRVGDVLVNASPEVLRPQAAGNGFPEPIEARLKLQTLAELDAFVELLPLCFNDPIEAEALRAGSDGTLRSMKLEVPNPWLGAQSQAQVNLLREAEAKINEKLTPLTEEKISKLYLAMKASEEADSSVYEQLKSNYDAAYQTRTRLEFLYQTIASKIEEATDTATELEGVWVLESAIDSDGNPRDIVKPDHWTFHGNRLLFDFATAGHTSCDVEVDATARTIRFLRDGKTAFSKADYVLEGDRLAIYERPPQKKIFQRRPSAGIEVRERTKTSDTFSQSPMNGDGPYCLVWESASEVRLRQEFTDTLNLDDKTRTAVNSLLTKTWTEYIDDERDHTKYSLAADGHLVAGYDWYARPGSHGVTGSGKTLPPELQHYLQFGNEATAGKAQSDRRSGQSE